MSLKKITSSFWAILAVVSLSLLNISCSDTETTDSTNFVIYYTGMTDIGPSMVGTISSPTYKGAAPSDFAITNITLNGEPYSGDCFEIDSETGEISISNTKNAATGRYSISISCVSGGKSYNFPNIVSIKMLAAAPEGITMTPNLLTADYGDVIDINSIADMPTSVVTTEGEHISITGYQIGAVELVTADESGENLAYQPLPEEYKLCFSVSNDGIFTIIQGSTSEILNPAVYSISLILKTKVGEAMLERAIQVKITSKPLALTYAKNYGKIEEKTTDEPTAFNSEIPTFKGSTDGLRFSIHSVTPATDKIKINEKNGQIYVEAVRAEALPSWQVRGARPSTYPDRDRSETARIRTDADRPCISGQCAPSCSRRRAGSEYGIRLLPRCAPSCGFSPVRGVTRHCANHDHTGCNPCPPA